MSIIIEQTIEDNIIQFEQNLIDINIATSQTISNTTIEVVQMGIQGEQGVAGGLLTKVSGESIPSHTPVAIINNLAYKLDSSNPLHQFAFVGFSENGTSTGQNCQIKQIGEVTLIGWGLIPNQHYLAGANGAFITNNLSDTNFTKVIGYATDSNTMQIIKDSQTINK